MPKFSDQSLANLSTCEYVLQRLFLAIVLHFDCTILDGHRGKLLQNEYFETGRSRKMWPDSNHNARPSKAVDAAPYPINWEDTDRFYYFAGYVMSWARGLFIPIRWGGDWNSDTEVADSTFDDLCHFELI